MIRRGISQSIPPVLQGESDLGWNLRVRARLLVSSTNAQARSDTLEQREDVCWLLRTLKCLGRVSVDFFRLLEGSIYTVFGAAWQASLEGGPGQFAAERAKSVKNGIFRVI
jgi:hypothetical protein